MACVADLSLFELCEKAGPRLIATKFGTEGDTDAEFEKLCDLIIGKAMEGYVRAEYGNLWETHQMRPHAFGHTWSPGYELPAGMLHGHAVGTCMGYGSYLAMLEGFLTEEEFHRIMKLINDLELALWHDVMDNHDLVYAANKKAYSKRGGNLCAPIPKTIGGCGYLNELSRERLDKTVDEYKAICQTYARGGKGIDVLCSDVGLEDPSLVAGAALEGLANKETGNNSNE
jgi:3-dehydroquinate synthase